MKNETERLRTINIFANTEERKREIAFLREEVKKQFPFLGDIVDRVQIQDNGAATSGGVGATDGTNIEVNADNILGNKKRGIFVLAHEAYHIKRSDVEKGSGKDNKIHNVVTDAVINANLRDMGGEFDRGVDIPSAREWGEEKLYNFIIDTLNFMKIDKFRDPERGPQEADVWKAVMGDHARWEALVQYHDRKEREMQERRMGGDKQQEGQKQPQSGKQQTERASA